MNPSEQLVDHALGVRWADVPANARRAALTFLHDSLCVGAAGRHAAHADAVLDIARGWGSGGTAGVLGRPDVQLPPHAAAFVNGFQIHGQEYDCVHEPAVLHPMATVLSAVLAEAARAPAPVDGEAFLAALVAGVDIAVCLGLAAGPLSFFRPATAGIFGCVAAIANLARLPRAVALDAFGHALSFASGTMQAHVEGKPALPVQVANAARNALVAVDLARAGMPGVRHPVDGPFGYFGLLEVEGTAQAAVAGLGVPGQRIAGRHIAEVSWKPFPTGRAGHGGIVATQRLMQEQGLRAEALASFTYVAPPLIHRLVGRPAHEAMEPGYARLCLAWLVAVTLTRGKVDLADFQPATLRDPAILALAAKVSVVDDGNPDPAAFVPARAIARLTDGRELRVDVTAQLGSPAWPLTDDQHRDKARGCLAFAGLPDVDAPLAALMADFPARPDALAALRTTGIIG